MIFSSIGGLIQSTGSAIAAFPSKDDDMAKKPNYGYEKRQKELAKKAKKAEKSKRRQEEKDQETSGENQETS